MVLEVEIRFLVLNRAVPVDVILRTEIYKAAAFSEYPALPEEGLERLSSWIGTQTFPFRVFDRDLMPSCPDNAVSAYSEHEPGQVLTGHVSQRVSHLGTKSRKQWSCSGVHSHKP